MEIIWRHNIWKTGYTYSFGQISISALFLCMICISRNDRYWKRCLVSFLCFSLPAVSFIFVSHLFVHFVSFTTPPLCFYTYSSILALRHKSTYAKGGKHFFVFLSNSKARLPHALIEGNFWHFFRTQSSQFAKILTNICSLFVFEASQYFQIKMVFAFPIPKNMCSLFVFKASQYFQIKMVI